MFGSNSSSLRTRAATVCTACHSRKVKCDLESKPNQRCTTCERRGQPCSPRRVKPGNQRSWAGTASTRRRIAWDSSEVVNEANDSLAPASAGEHGGRVGSEGDDAGRHDQQLGYIGEQSLMAGPSPGGLAVQWPAGTQLVDINNRLLHACGALTPPSRILLQAAMDTYRTQIRSRIPVVDEHELCSDTPPPVILQQALCLVHLILRYPRTSSAIATSEEYYAKLRTLIFTNYETDSVVSLKAMCLLHCWNMVSPDTVTTDSAWSWTGTAIRYALHLGLHKESTYSRFSSPHVARRIAWYLWAQDRVQTLCWNRPPMLSSPVFDVAPLELAEFPIRDEQALFFMNFASLLKILEGILDLTSKGNRPSQKQTDEFLQMFIQWIDHLPREISLYDPPDSRPFLRCVYELHIFYFVGLVLFCHHFEGSLGLSAASIISITASTYATRLYEELDCRDEIIKLLSIHNWCLMVSCIPQIGYQNSIYDEDQSCARDLKTLTAVLTQMTDKWPSARRILALVERAWHPKSLSTVGHQNPSARGQNEGSNEAFGLGGQEVWTVDAKQLFPFPSHTIPRPGLLSACNLRSYPEDSEDVLLAGNLGWIYEELSYNNIDAFSFN